MIEAAAELSVREGVQEFFARRLRRRSPGHAEGPRGEVPGVNICGVYAPPPALVSIAGQLDKEICQHIEESRPPSCSSASVRRSRSCGFTTT